VTLITHYDSDYNFQTEVGVQDSPVFNSLTMPVDSRAPIDGTETAVGTAFALFNPNSSDSVILTPTYFDIDGVMTTASAITLQPLAQKALYFGEIGNEGTIAILQKYAGTYPKTVSDAVTEIKKRIKSRKN
jgi:hypothetical protein